MASIRISDKSSTRFSSVNQKDKVVTSIDEKRVNLKITDKSYLLDKLSNKSVQVEVLDKIPSASLSSLLPFRIKITNIGIDGYGPNNPAPIGIAVIGISNYIL